MNNMLMFYCQFIKQEENKMLAIYDYIWKIIFSIAGAGAKEGFWYNLIRSVLTSIK